MPLDANATKVRNALFEAIAATADQVRATNAADVLARDNALPTSLSVASGLHPQWVRAQIGANAATAIFAVTNCRDPEVLDAFARTETRVTVLRAIAYNECATDETVRFCNDRLDFARPAPAAQPDFQEALDAGHRAVALDERDVPEAQRVPAPFARPGFTVLDADDPLAGLPKAVLIATRPRAAIDMLLERALALNNQETISTIVCAYYGPAPENGPTIKLWNALGVSPLDLIETLPKTRQRYIFELLLEEREDNAWTKPVNIWDQRLIELMIASKAVCPTHWDPMAGEEFLSPGALKSVLSTPRLWPLLYLAPLTQENVTEVFGSVKGDVRINLIDALFNDGAPEVISTALLDDGPGSIRAELAASGFSSIAHLLCGPSDPAILIAASVADYNELISYLLEGEYFNESKERMPLPEHVPELVALALADAPDLEEFAEQMRYIECEAFEAYGPDYTRALMDHLPCAWEKLLTANATSHLVIERIEEVVGLDVAMARLFNADALAPATLPQILATLA